MGRALAEGYATAGTDTGHKGGNALFAIGHPEKLIDLASRAVHETAVQSKALIASYYHRPPQLSYWNGCSTGGRQGLFAHRNIPKTSTRSWRVHPPTTGHISTRGISRCRSPR